MKTITVSLPDEIAATVEERLAKGEYSSWDDAVTLAVAEWLCMLDTPPMIDENSDLRDELQIGIDQADRGEVVDLEVAMARLQDRTQARLASLAVTS